jgi:hypothetical protein
MIFIGGLVAFYAKVDFHERHTTPADAKCAAIAMTVRSNLQESCRTLQQLPPAFNAAAMHTGANFMHTGA